MPRHPENELKHGQKFNRLTVKEYHHSDKRWRKHYLCICECGNEKVIQGSLMTSGNTKSCACLSREVKKARLLPLNRGVISQIILGYKRHAKGRGFSWELSFDDVSNIINKPCHYCGIPPSNNKITKNCAGFLYSGIDRIDSSKDYKKDNVVPCCSVCNVAKRDMSKTDFLSWVKRVYEHSETAMADQWGPLP